MKKILLSFAVLAWCISALAAPRINRIDPTDWYVGMKDPTLQLMVYGPGIKAADVSTNYPGVKITDVVRLDSPNYLLVYLDLSGAQAGKMKLDFTIDGNKKSVNYVLKTRAMKGEEHIGFDASDVLYLMMPDRFANGNVKNDVVKGLNPYKCNRAEPSLRHGGDLAGVRQHLDYLSQLGITALWMTPVLENNMPDNGNQSSYHGYAITDYYNVDPRFGSNDEYRQLIADAHARHIKVIMDMVFNHCGSSHPWLADMPSKDWFNNPDYKNNYRQSSYKLTPVLDPYASKADLSQSVDGWFVPSMPDLNQRNPHLMRYLIQNSEWWIETAGIDGIRMDTYPYADKDAMTHWMTVLNTEYPNFNVVGETWVTEPGYTAAFQKDSKLTSFNSQLKTVMDFCLFDRMSQARGEETDSWWKGLNRVYNSFVYDYLYPDPTHVMAFIENHDTDRFLGDGNDVDQLKQALTLLLTTRRIPQLYYGTEVLMNGTKAVTDGNVRKDFMGGFPGDSRSAFTSTGRTAEENDMFNWLSRLLHWRQGNEVISKGSMIQFQPQEGVYAFSRAYDGKKVLVLLNGTSKDVALPMERYAEIIGEATQGVDVLTGKTYQLKGTLSLTPRQSIILRIEM